MRDDFPGDSNFGIDAEAIERSVRESIDAQEIGRTVRESLKGVDTALRNLGVRSSVAAMTSDHEERRFVVGSDSELFIESRSGDIDVRVGQSSNIVVRASGDDEIAAVPMTQEGNRVEIHAASSMAGSHEIDFEIEVPEGCSVTVKSVESDIDIRGTQAPVSIVAGEGDVEVRDVSGECAIRTTQGDITLRRAMGRLNLQTSEGDAEILESRLAGCKLHSISGDVTLETSLIPTGEYTIETVNGDVELLIASGTGATIEMASANGDVSSRLHADVLASDSHHWRGQILGGGASVDVRSANGDLELAESTRVSSEMSVPVAASDAGQPSTGGADHPDETSDVLGALERGEISVDEAMARLDDLA